MLLLDTCALLWLAADRDKLSRPATRALKQSAGGVFVSAISAFEIGWKHRNGKLELPLDPMEWYALALQTHGLSEVPIDGDIAGLSVGLPGIHRDPCDRFIIATAMAKGLDIVTADRVIPGYPDVKVIW